jgi:hypothetical protein
MVLTLIPECRICNGDKYYRELDPAGRGQLERCPVCNPEPAKPLSDLVTVRREDLREILWACVNAGWQSSSSGSFCKAEAVVNAKLTEMEAAAR